MILDESLYDPTIPETERGKGAWDRSKPTKRISLGKRSREDSIAGQEGGKRKLRRTASTKLNSQSESIWGDIIGAGSVMQVARSGQWGTNEEEPTQEDEHVIEKKPTRTPQPSIPQQAVENKQVSTGMFSGSRFYLHGLTPRETQILCNHVLPQGGEVSETLDELPSTSSANSPGRFFIVVPHDLPITEQPDLPQSQPPIEKVTVWWVERCLHYKRFMEPSEHVIGQPFRVFPVEGFAGMTICSSAFAGIDLLHFKKAVELLGAKYSEEMTPQSSILVNKSLVALRKDKLEHALQWKIPIVSANWLWDSIEAGMKLSSKDYRYRPQKRSDSLPNTGDKARSKDIQANRSTSGVEKQISRANSLPSKHAKLPRNSGLDSSAFAPDDTSQEKAIVKQESESYSTEPPPGGSPTQEFTNRSEPLSERNPNSPSKTVSTAPAPSNHPAPRESTEDMSNAISNLLAKTKTAVQPISNDPEGRKRSTNRILGRVTSNVSTASTNHSRATSVDSTATHGHPVEYPSYNNSANTQMEMLINGDKNTHKSGDSQPPPTQLQYEDPESEAVTERVMARMLGENAPPKRKGVKEKTVTIGDFEPRTRATRQGRTVLR
jgi:DNA replication regulator DPB11